MVFKAIMSVIDNALTKIRESFLSKACEKFAESAHNAVNNVMGYASIVTTLKDNLKLLKIRASDVEDEIRNAELSGNKKRKREVEEWLKQVKSIEADADQPKGLMTRLNDGGRAAQLNQQVQKLYKQSCHFGELLLNVSDDD